MIDKKYKLLIDKLIEKTKSKNAIWLKTSRDNEFKIKLKSSVITTDIWTNEATSEQFVDLVIRNYRGEVIARLEFSKEEEPGKYDLLNALNNCAREAYYNVDETINDIFEELSSSAKVGNDESDLDPFDELY